MGQISFTPVVCVQNDQRVMGIIMRYVCWGTPPPPRPSWGAWQLTGQPTYPPPPLPDPQKFSHPVEV